MYIDSKTTKHEICPKPIKRGFSARCALDPFFCIYPVKKIEIIASHRKHCHSIANTNAAIAMTTIDIFQAIEPQPEMQMHPPSPTTFTVPFAFTEKALARRQRDKTRPRMLRDQLKEEYRQISTHVHDEAKATDEMIQEYLLHAPKWRNVIHQVIELRYLDWVMAHATTLQNFLYKNCHFLFNANNKLKDYDAKIEYYERLIDASYVMLGRIKRDRHMVERELQAVLSGPCRLQHDWWIM
jgi:hypothetical protein